MTEDIGLAHFSVILGSFFYHLYPLFFSLAVVRSETADGMASTLVLPVASRADASPFGVSSSEFLDGEVNTTTTYT